MKEEKRLFSEFKEKLYQLIASSTDLKDQLAALQILKKKLERENFLLKEQCENLKISKILSIKKDDFEGVKKQIFFLNKEVAMCIELLKRSNSDK